MSRIEQIRRMLQAEPDDVLLNFALAMELMNAGRNEQALLQFDRVLEIDPHYTAAYIQKAKLLASLGRSDEAREVLRAGIAAAESAGDSHSTDKMTELLQAMGGE